LACPNTLTYYHLSMRRPTGIPTTKGGYMQERALAILDNHDPAFQIAACEVIREVYIATGKAGLRDLFERGFGGPRDYIFYEQDGSIPAWAAVFDRIRWVVFIAGTNNGQQAFEQFFSWIIGVYEHDAFSCSNVGLRTALRIWNQIWDKLPGFAANMTVCGHSYGAVIAQVLAALLLNRPRPWGVDLLTFGGPKPGDSRLSQVLGAADSVRIMNYADAVCLLPPTRDEAPNAWLAVNPVTAALWDSYVHPVSGVILGPDGSQKLSRNLNPAPIITEKSLVNWAQGGGGFMGMEHSLDTYAHRLSLGPQARLAFPELPEAPVGLSKLNYTIPPEIIPQVAPEATPPMALIPPDALPTTGAGPEPNSLFWMGQLCASFGSVSSSKTCKRALDRFLRRLMKSDAISLQATLAAFQAFLNQASIGGPGWDRPLVNA
jgi:pimeloyl-ACP methyl ester carboxylesterase